MKRNFVVVFFCLSFGFQGFAQGVDASFDEAYNQVIMKIDASDMEQSKRSVDSLLKVSSNDYQKTKSFLLMAVVNIQMDNKVDALFYALEAEKAAVRSKIYQWQVRAAGFLSSLYREVGLIEEAIKHIDIAEKANAKLKEYPDYTIVQMNINDERAYYEHQVGNLEKAIDLLYESKELIGQIEGEMKPGLSIANYASMGTIYLELKEFDKARNAFQMALDLIQDTKNLHEVLVYIGMGELELHAKDYPAALAYLQKAESYLGSNQNVEFKIMLFKSLSNYYEAIGMHKEALRYEGLRLEAFNHRAKVMEEIFNQLIKKSDDSKRLISTRNHYLIAYVIASILFILALFVCFRWVRKRDKSKYEAFIKHVNDNSASDVVNGKIRTEELSQIIPLQRKGAFMPAETEKRILEDLLALEKDLFFTRKDISLASLASQLDTNTKYLSHVINTHKEKDFNNYINELRVGYIIRKFQTDPKYLSYKLAYIAEEAGFSSHSKFTAVFKSITGLSPSVFIAHIKKTPTAISDPV